jgi:CYTH domain-containing protein
MGREYEVKLLALTTTFPSVVQYLKSRLILEANAFNEGTSVDLYWTPAPNAAGSFIRLRANNDENTLTTKVNDKNDITDRKEYNVSIEKQDRDDLQESLTAVLGEPTAIMWRYADFKLPMTGTVISVIQNIEKKSFVFIEVESNTRDQVDQWLTILNKDGQLTLKQVKNSFYDIFVKQHGVLL